MNKIDKYTEYRRCRLTNLERSILTYLESNPAAPKDKIAEAHGITTFRAFEIMDMLERKSFFNRSLIHEDWIEDTLP